MANILKLYLDTINNSPESKILFLEGEIQDYQQFIELYENDIKKSQNEDEINKLQEDINSCREEIVKIEEIIQSIRNGNMEFMIGVENVETNMK